MKNKNVEVRNRGNASMLSLCLLLSVSVVGMALFGLAMSSSRITKFGWQKSQANYLAEAGIYTQYAQMANVHGNSSVNVSPVAATSLAGSGAGNSSTSADGTYSSKVLSSSSSIVNGQLTYLYTVEGTGVAANNVSQSKIRATFTMTASGMAGFTFGDAAIKTAGNAIIAGGSFTQDPTGKHGAGVMANGTITANGNGAYVDGNASYYLSSNLNNKAYSTSQMGSPMPFPDSATTSTWRSTWLSQSQVATPSKPSGNIVNGNVSITKNSTLTSPMYITGNLSMSGTSTITLNADPAAPKPCVLFVHGSITVNGGSKLVNNGVLIVSDGIQTFNGNSNVYSASDMVNCGLMCFNTDPNLSIKINGGAGVANVGVVYAINGGVTLSGGSVFQGSITAGGTPSTVSMSGGSSVRYEAGWNASFAPGAPSYTSSGLSNWVTTR